ncbi:MAG: YicC family protein [Chitinophagales bacterium]|nr:YicC family protein [Chitinophagales bacterium]
MVYSMTGYGTAEAKMDEVMYNIDIRSLNSKGLDLNIKLPEQLKSYESFVRNTLKSLKRGKIDLQISTHTIGVQKTVGNLNLSLMNKYYKQLLVFSQENGVDIHKMIGNLLRMPGILDDSITSIDEEEVLNFLNNTLNIAIENLVTHRKLEGESQFTDVQEKLLSIRESLSKISPYEKERIDKIRERFDEQLKNITEEYPVDSGRLEIELIFYIERLDINEEKVRLATHLDYFEDILKDKTTNEKGKKLNFVAQEMLREVNTIGSKANHVEIQKLVVLMKDDIEKIKEQTNNIL